MMPQVALFGDRLLWRGGRSVKGKWEGPLRGDRGRGTGRDPYGVTEGEELGGTARGHVPYGGVRACRVGCAGVGGGEGVRAAWGMARGRELGGTARGHVPYGGVCARRGF